MQEPIATAVSIAGDWNFHRIYFDRHGVSVPTFAGTTVEANATR